MSAPSDNSGVVRSPLCKSSQACPTAFPLEPSLRLYPTPGGGAGGGGPLRRAAETRGAARQRPGCGGPAAGEAGPASGVAQKGLLNFLSA